MPTIAVRTSVAANSESANVLAGSPFEFVAVPSIVTLAATQRGAAPSDITSVFQIGGESVVQGGNVSDRAASPTFRDDLFARGGGAAGERLFLTFLNTTVGALNVDILLEILPI